MTTVYTTPAINLLPAAVNVSRPPFRFTFEGIEMDYNQRAEIERRNAETRRLNRLRSQRLRANINGRREPAESFLISFAFVVALPLIVAALAIVTTWRRVG